MAKPFSIQAPEDIAKEYAGNKQRIAQAAQMGIVDPTAAVLAGMFIDRMRGAQMQEGANPPSVAQEVMGGAPPAPPAPLPTAGGLGASPQAAPPMAPPMPTAAPQMDMPMPGGAPMGEAPIGMADGGLAMLPVPDAMFDEPDDGGYAGGGLVAFADGGPAGSYNWGSYIEEMVRKLDPNIQISGRGRTPSRNAQVGGVANSYHLIDAARDIRTPEGMDKNEFIAQLKGVFGPDYDVLPSKGRSVHVEPGPKLGEKVRAGTRPSGAPAVIPERNIGTAQGRNQSIMDNFTALQAQFGPTKEEQEVDAARMARAKEMASDEYYEKTRKSDMWQTLAEIGFNMASSKSPYLLQAIGEAAAASMPGARADKKERQELKNRALDAMAAMNGMKRKDNLQLYSIAVDAAKTGIEQEQFEAQMGLKREELDLARDKLNAEIEAAKSKGIDVDTAIFQMFMSGDPAMKEAAKEYLGSRYPRAVTGGALTPEQIRANVEAGRGGTGGFAEGQTAKDTQGKTIVFQGGQWVYP